MFTTGSKWFFGLGAVSFVLAVRLRLHHRRHRLGPLTAGYNGGVGDHLGYTLLVSIGVAASFLGITALVSRDADPSVAWPSWPAPRGAAGCRPGPRRRTGR